MARISRFVPALVVACALAAPVAALAASSMSPPAGTADIDSPNNAMGPGGPLATNLKHPHCGRADWPHALGCSMFGARHDNQNGEGGPHHGLR